ncbi:hypothetical protein [Parabacteroides sp.]
MIGLPLKIDKSDYRFGRADNVASINSFIDLIIATPKGTFVCDPNFGFTFSNLRFEIFNELEERINSSSRSAYETNDDAESYEKKVSGSSKNSNTFAKDLQNAIERYEPRLSNVEVVMSYVKVEKLVKIHIKANLLPKGEEYAYETSIGAWNK